MEVGREWKSLKTVLVSQVLLADILVMFVVESTGVALILEEKTDVQKTRGRLYSLIVH